MISRSKFIINNETIKKLFETAGIIDITEITPLGAGEYNSVYLIIANGKEYVIKIAPNNNDCSLTYENELMRSEIFWYQTMKKNTSIRIPEIYFVDFDKKIIPSDYFIMEKIEGYQLDKMTLGKSEKENCAAEKAKMVSQIHNIKNDKFGYIQNGLYDNWYLALVAIVETLIKDAERKNKKSNRGIMLLKYIEKYKDVLQNVECTMVNFDLWDPNIICKRDNNAIEYAWIDPERSFWGDRIADFVCLEMNKPFENKQLSLSAYNSISDTKIQIGKDEKIRYAVAQGYLALIMEVEKFFRYTPKHFGWWRNVLASGFLYKQAFSVLKNG